MIKRGFKPFKVNLKKITYGQLSETQIFRRFYNNAENLLETYEIEPQRLIQSLFPLMVKYRNSKDSSEEEN